MGKHPVLSDVEILSQRIEELAREKQKFQDLVEGSVQGILIHRNFQFLFGNQALADIFGYESTEEMRALGNMRRTLAPEEVPRLQALHDSRMRGESPPSHYEFQGIRKDGSRIWVEHNSRLVDWEGEPAVQTTMFDISERKHAEEGLKASQRLLKTVLDTIPQWVFVKDRESRYLMTNNAFAESRNARPEELIGAHTIEVNDESPASRELFLETDRRVLESGERVELPEYSVTLPDGSTEIRHAVKLPLLDEDGTIVGVVGVSTDITEAKRAEEDLKESEERFRRLIDTSLQGVYIHDKHRFLYVNYAFSELFGYKSPQEVLEVGDCLQFYAPDDRERLDGYYKARISGGTPPIRYEFQGLHKDGSTLWLENLVQVVVWRGRQAILATVVDISERKQAQDSLEANQRLLRTVIDTLPHAIYVKNLEGRFNLVNRAMARLHEQTVEEMVGKHTSDLPFPQVSEQEILVEMDRRVLETGEAVIDPEVRITGSGGETIRHIQKHPLFDNEGDLAGIVGISQDITEQKRIENELRESQEAEATAHARLMDAIEALPASFTLYDAEDRFVICNNVTLELFSDHAEILKPGVSYEKVIRTSYEMGLLKFDPERKEELIQARLLEHREAPKFFEQEWADGRWFEIHHRPTADGGTVSIRLEITERKRFEQELILERRNLEQTVIERTKELEAMLISLEDSNLQLQKANLARAQFISSMSHELRTPLNAILGFSDLLRGQHFGELNQKQMNQVAQIEGSGKHLLSLINDLLDMAKIDAGGMEVELEPIDVKEFLDSTAAMMGSQFSIKSISVRVRCDPDLPTLYADSRKIRQIMLNLLSNAIKFTHEKGNIVIRAEGQDGAAVRISVQDDGIGIEEEELEHIFSKYYQVKNAKDAQPQGVGIGLAMTKRLVELHGGQIDVSSTPESGSTFWFELPVRNPPGSGSPPLAQAEEGEHPRSRPRRILVVEDNEVNLALILDMLSIHGHETAVARNGLEAIELAKSHTPELILMDVRMPVMDGLEAARKLREMPEFANIPIIALTASTGSDAEERQLAAGFTEHLAKPIQASELFATLEHHLN